MIGNASHSKQETLSLKMDDEVADASSGPLTFAMPCQKVDPFQFAPWENCTCQCFLCECKFKWPEEKDSLLLHTYSKHRVIITNSHSIASQKGYMDHWRMKFSEQPLSSFCITQTETDDQQNYLLSGFHPADCEIRKELMSKRLEWVLDFQKWEREDKSFDRGCLFCQYIEKGSRSNYITHLSHQHNFQIGKPDNLVFIDKLIDKLEEKINELKCIYCENVFKDPAMLKRHMRKKYHKKINPKNKEYDPFYVISYATAGKFKERMDNLPDANEESVSSKIDGVYGTWCDWIEQPSSVVCLFCTHACCNWEDILNHMEENHGFSYKSEIGTFNFYEQVKIVNYIRREIYLHRCYVCRLKAQTQDDLLTHMQQCNHFTLPAKEDWNHPEYFFSTYENDAFLYLLEDNEEDPFEDTTWQMFRDMQFSKVMADGKKFP